MTLPRFLPVPPQPQPQAGSPRLGVVGAAPSPVVIRVPPLAAVQPSVRFPAIGALPTGFSVLTIDGQARGDTAATAIDIVMHANDDGGANYVWQQLFGNNNAASSGQNPTLTNSPFTARIPAANAGASGGVFHIRIANYGGSVFPKEAIITHQSIELFAIASMFILVRGWHWTGTVPITSITLLPAVGNFAVGSSFQMELR